MLRERGKLNIILDDFWFGLKKVGLSLLFVLIIALRWLSFRWTFTMEQHELLENYQEILEDWERKHKQRTPKTKVVYVIPPSKSLTV